MSDAAQYLLFFGLLWVRWRLAKDAAAERAARDAWALVQPREGCTRTIPGCICARDNLGEWCVHRRPSSKTPNAADEPDPTAAPNCQGTLDGCQPLGLGSIGLLGPDSEA